MNIRRIEISNFRLLKDFRIDLEEEMSLVIGKNNVGKTSLLHILDKFLNGTKFSYEDFNLDFRHDLHDLIEGEKKSEDNYQTQAISMRLYIHYSESDDLSNIGLILMDLDYENHNLLIEFSFELDYTSYLSLKLEWEKFSEHEKAKANDNYTPKDIKYFFEKLKLYSFFKVVRRSLFIDKDEHIDPTYQLNLKDVPQFHLEDLISFRYIGAKREVDNKKADKTLSEQTTKLYSSQDKDQTQISAIESFHDHIAETDEKLSKVYDNIFKDIIDTVAIFGGYVPNDSSIRIHSAIQHNKLIEDNTRVMYKHGDKELPENYNGLGYMNLISMIFEIEIKRNDFMRKDKRIPADINLLFIEEPEAHTHPQMQYIFIQNIKKFLSDGIKIKINDEVITRPLQYIISTHSSHIVTESNFDDIKYLRRDNNTNSVSALNMKDFRTDDPDFRFLKQYLTLNRSELFFADKAIFIEGDTERILLPSIMRKLDQEVELRKGELPLLSQNISIIEVGAYSHKFAKFFNFIGLKKSLVLTDIDICSPSEKNTWIADSFKPNIEQHTSNESLKKYYKLIKISEFLELEHSKKYFSYNIEKQEWQPDPDGNMLVLFQEKENEYQPRSFEDSFINKNSDFFKNQNNTFLGLKQKAFEEYKNNVNSTTIYELATKGISSKATLAIDILLNSKKDDDLNLDFGGWEIPSYIKEGLLWLRKL